MKIAVTGGTGFIGKNLVRVLIEKGHTVRVLTRNRRSEGLFSEKIDLFEGDLLKKDLRLGDFFKGIDVVYHCAGALQEGQSIYETNVIATNRLLAEASGKIKHWVQLSSIGVYGKHKDGIVNENNMVNPSNLYEQSKAEADQLVKEISEQGHFTYSIVRPSNVYGNDMVSQHLFKMIHMIRNNFFFYIGNKLAIANYIHVDNVVEGMVLCGEKVEAENQVFNISDSAKLEDVINIIARTLDKKPPVLILPHTIIKCISIIASIWKRWPLTSARIDALTSHTIYSNEKIEKKLGYKHKISITDGFEQLAQYWRSNFLKGEY